MSSNNLLTRSYTQKEWTELIYHILVYLSENDPAPELNFFKSERQIIPSSFLNSSLSHFCYAFKGVFLPSGNLDGIVWKPSQGAKPAGRNLMKRYFYYKRDSLKVNRQVIWLTQNENWCFVDYRYNFKGKIKISDLTLPEDFNIAGLLHAVHTSNPNIFQSTPLNVKKKSKPKSKSKTSFIEDEEEDEEGNDEDNGRKELLLSPSKLFDFPQFDTYGITQSDTLFSPPQSQTQPTSSEITVPHFHYPTYVVPHKSEHHYPPTFDLEECLLHQPTSLFEEETNFDNNISNLFLDLEPVKPEMHFDDELNMSSKKRKLDMIETHQPLISIAAPSLSFQSPSFVSWDWPSASNFFSTGFEYFFDKLVNLLCNQLIFQRRFFQKYSGNDSEAFLTKVRQYGTSVDLREFPGSAMKNFFEYVSHFCQAKVDELPTIYCLVCGEDVNHHDEHKHKEFFSRLDQSLVISLQEKAGNFYDLIKQYIMFLLRNPSSHEALNTFLMDNLHCPFCSLSGGKHSAVKHQQWIRLWKIEHCLTSNPPPEPSSNVYDYTKSAFEWIVDQMPFYIPPYLLSLHYAKYVKSFVECLVTSWKAVRLAI